MAVRSALLIGLAAPTAAFSTAGPHIGICPDIGGKWVSPTYYAHKVNNVGETLPSFGDLTMSLEITMLEEKDGSGCPFKAINKWSQLGGEPNVEHAIGFVDNTGTALSILEVGAQPVDGTTGQITGILTGKGDDTVLHFHYLGRTSTYAYVFDTALTMQCKHCTATHSGGVPCCE